MVYNTTVSLTKPNCTNCVDLGKCQDRFELFYWSKTDSNYLDVILKVFKKDDNKEFPLVQNVTMGVTDRNQFMQLRIQTVIAAENYAKEENLSTVLIPTLLKDMNEQLKLAHKVVDVVDRANKNIRWTLLRYTVDQIKFFMRKSNFFKEERGREVSTNCLCQIET